jgi:hypothetical protein
MPVKSFDKQADIPKGFEDDYEEVEGKWVYKDPATDLKSALDAEKVKREAAEKNAKAAAKALKEKEREGDGATPDQLKKIREEIAAEIRAEVDEENAPKLKAAEALAAENRTLKLDTAVKKLLGDAGIFTEVDKVWKLHADEFDLSTDGKPVVKAKPTADVAKHVAGIAKQYPHWVKGSQASGGGAAGQQTVTTGGAADDFGTMTPEARLAAAHASGATS